MPATRDEVFAKVKAIVRAAFKVEESEVTEEAGLATDLSADSLGLAEFVMYTERGFVVNGSGLKIPDDEIDKFRTVGLVVDFLMSKNVDIAPDEAGEESPSPHAGSLCEPGVGESAAVIGNGSDPHADVT